MNLGLSSNATERQYIAIDLKSFYASVECVERGLDPLDTLLVVADKSRTDKTICLAVSPALKACGIGGRPRLFEVVQRVRQINSTRGRKGASISRKQLETDTSLSVDYVVAPPRMAHYIEYSTRIYNIYLRYVAPEDVHVYSIDEVFIDVTDYLRTRKQSAHEMAMEMIRAVLSETGITATAGIGTNLYLAKIAMDIVAKKMPADADGVRIAELTEQSYRHKLWAHTPITDFWRVGSGIASRLAQHGIYTMGDVALQSHLNEDVLYRLLGVNAELLIDHAWGYEPVTMPLVKSYRPETRSVSTGQVLCQPYPTDRALVVAMEMADAAALDLLDKGLCTNQMTLTIGYDVEALTRKDALYSGPIHTDRYGRQIPQHSHGTENLEIHTFSQSVLTEHVSALFQRIVRHDVPIRRLTISFNNLIPIESATTHKFVQLDLFSNPDEQINTLRDNDRRAKREQQLMQAEIELKKRFGKNAVMKGLNYADGATQRSRNTQIGGHHE